MSDLYNTFPIVVVDEYGKMYFEPYKRWYDQSKVTDFPLWGDQVAKILNLAK